VALVGVVTEAALIFQELTQVQLLRLIEVAAAVVVLIQVRHRLQVVLEVPVL
jgi:hypothetical protein|tara:strand:- start:1600 stop:1755 length:156 start_codon:yes stop_codon:yes gene_type:complete